MTATVKIWDLAVRLFHWSLVASFAVAWLSAEEWDDLHYFAGYAAIALVLFRIIWGICGSPYARFSQFVRKPSVIGAYLKDVLTGHEKRYLGHNPAGGAMIMALIICLIGVSVTGWMYTTDRFWGVEWVEEIHEALANLMLGLVVVHILGVIVASFRHHENLIRSMITGLKRAPSADDVV